MRSRRDAFGPALFVWGWPLPGYQYHVARLDLANPAPPRIVSIAQIPPQ